MNKTLITILMALTLALAFIQGIKAQTTDNTQTFFSNDYAGISIRVNATQETTPGENLTMKLWLNCTATGVRVEYLNTSVYGFRGGREKILINATHLIQDVPMAFNYTSEYNFTVQVPLDVWDATYTELYLKYLIYSSGFEYNPSFSITIVRNIYYEQLQEDFENLNETYWQLNQTFSELQQNYTALQKSLGELDSTRQVAIALAITTVFFVATTLFLVMRKPKQYW